MGGVKRGERGCGKHWDVGEGDVGKDNADAYEREQRAVGNIIIAHKRTSSGRSLRSIFYSPNPTLVTLPGMLTSIFLFFPILLHGLLIGLIINYLCTY